MPTTKTSIVIGVKSSTSISAGEYCTISNLSKTGVIKGVFDSNGECVVNPSDYGYDDWANGDVLSVQISGRLIGSKNVTISKGGATATVTTSADTASPAIDL